MFSDAKEPVIQVIMQEYWHPEVGSYIELYYYTDYGTLSYETQEAGFQSGLEITSLVLDGEEVVSYDKIALFSPVVRDTFYSQEVVGISKLAVPEGDWLIEISYKDLHGDSEVRTLKDSIHVHSPSQVSLSTLLLTTLEIPSKDWERFGVSGMPKSVGSRYYFPSEDTLLQYYTEFYQPTEPARHLLTFSLNDVSTGETLSNYYGVKVLKAEEFQPIVGRMNLSKLPSGNYYLKVKISDSTGLVVVRDSILIGRRNDRYSEPIVIATDLQKTFLDELKDMRELLFAVDCLYPIAEDAERTQINSLIEQQDSIKIRNFIASFWVKRRPDNPEVAWREYMTLVDDVNREFDAALFRGFQSDRGRVRLQYGEPTLIERRAFDNTTYPYEIWQYDQLSAPNRREQVNKVFVFVNRSLAGNNYELIHSDAYSEPFYPNWKNLVNRGGNANSNNGGSTTDPFGSRLNNNTIINGGSSSGYQRR